MAKAPKAQAAAVRLERVSLAPKPPPQRFTLTSILREGKRERGHLIFGSKYLNNQVRGKYLLLGIPRTAATAA